MDPAPGLASLTRDPLLSQHNIVVETGKVNNINKNPVAEHAIQELGQECLHLSPEGTPLSKVTLVLATANMNARIRAGGRSTREIWTQRDQMSGEQLPIDDCQLILKQHFARTQNHAFSTKCKSHGKGPLNSPAIGVGDLVYLTMDRDKTKAQDKYMVMCINEGFCQVRKFSKSQFRSKLY